MFTPIYLNNDTIKILSELYLYWTAEKHRKDALMEIEYDENLVIAVGKHFDEVAACIINKNFEIKNMPDKTKVCKECDLNIIAE